MTKERTSCLLSKHTKDFVSRYALIAIRKTQKNGFSATLFKTHKLKMRINAIILACRGTEKTYEDFLTNFGLFLDVIPRQCLDIARFCET